MTSGFENVRNGILFCTWLSATLFVEIGKATYRQKAMLTKESSTQIGISSKRRPHRERRWTWWLIPKPFDLASSLLYIGILVPYLYNFATHTGYNPPLALWQAVLMVASTVLLLTVDRIEYFFYGDETPARAAVFLLLTRIVFIEILCWLDQFRYTPFLYLIVLFLACQYFGELAGYGLAALAWIVYIVKHMYYSPGWLGDGTERHYLVLFTVGIVLVITIARVVAKEKASRTRAEELFAELEVSHQQLKAYAEQVAELATTRERNRLARDIHDTLGHYLTVINVQLEKALAFRDKKPEVADQAVSNAKRLAGEALQDVRRSVGALRTNEELPEFTTSLTELVERIQSDSCTLELHMEGDESGFSRQGLLALYRAAQEGLTNIQKHAGANHIWLDLHFGEYEASLVLRDDGRGFDTAKWQQAEPGGSGSYGLLGVQERLELVGGCMQVESAPGQGTALRVTFPKNGHVPMDNRLR
jgi:signal transduction histidine kinase